MLKLVENNHYHIWTDALHARALAHEASNRWDRGTYVRWTVITAWIVLELACQDALDEPNISYRFKENLDKTIGNKSLTKLDWSGGVWQQVLKVQTYRKNAVHRFAQESDLFPVADIADETIQIVRTAVVEIYGRAGKDIPPWVNDDNDQGWANKGFRVFANAYSVPPGLDEHAPDTIKITYTYKDSESIREVLPAETDPNPHVENLIATIGLPVSAIKVYKGEEVIQEIRFPVGRIRGT